MRVRAWASARDFPVLVCESALPAGANSAVVDGSPVIQAKVFHRFGHTMEPSGSGWTANVRDVDGSIMARCQVEALRLSCSG